MNAVIKKFNIPVGDLLFEVEVNHDQYLNIMTIKVDGEVRAPDVTRKFWVAKTIYEIEIGRKTSATQQFPGETTVTITAMRRARDTYAYEIKVGEQTLQEYKEQFLGGYLAWKVIKNTEESANVYFDKTRNILWCGGKRIGRAHYHEGEVRILFTIFNMPGYIKRELVNRKMEHICKFGEKYCGKLDFEKEGL